MFICRHARTIEGELARALERNGESLAEILPSLVWPLGRVCLLGEQIKYEC